jgi:3'-phosphoadenosine 5'-phosphosulfate sulfotransferase (PAPS reductase)/FAD synthetase
MFTEHEQMLLLKAKLKIEQVIENKEIENLAISFSGGKDSTVLKHLVESINPNIKSVFCDTGVEYNTIVDFVKRFDLQTNEQNEDMYINISDILNSERRKEIIENKDFQKIIYNKYFQKEKIEV